MSEIPDLAFCETCLYRGVVTDGNYCARTGIDNLQEILGHIGPNASVINLDPSRPTVSVDVLSVTFGSEMLLGVARCIQQVSEGGQPLPPQDC